VLYVSMAFKVAEKGRYIPYQLCTLDEEAACNVDGCLYHRIVGIFHIRVTTIGIAGVLVLVE
jgi:hypothetical protein